MHPEQTTALSCRTPAPVLLLPVGDMDFELAMLVEQKKGLHSFVSFASVIDKYF